jgi:DNA-binding response OmpR family regulator
MSTNRILIVEDDDAIRSTLSDLLELEGYDVQSKENGQEGLNFLHSTTELPDLILLDLMMPVLDGFGFCELKEQSLNISHIPVIIMSADGHITEKKRRAKAKDYLKKPLDFDELLQAIKNVLL